MDFWYFFVTFVLILVFATYFEVKVLSILKKEHLDLFKRYGSPIPFLTTGIALSFRGELILGGYYKSVIDSTKQRAFNKLRVCYSLQWLWALILLIYFILTN
ncbi:MAG: hypothetical protein HWE16_17345 [Gammaproteobacteria bacterium]|nr:hypothetical protein [Gammaproteobacteria bacterium]